MKRLEAIFSLKISYSLSLIRVVICLYINPWCLDFKGLISGLFILVFLQESKDFLLTWDFLHLGVLEVFILLGLHWRIKPLFGQIDFF